MVYTPATAAVADPGELSVQPNPESNVLKLTTVAVSSVVCWSVESDAAIWGSVMVFPPKPPLKASRIVSTKYRSIKLK